MAYTDPSKPNPTTHYVTRIVVERVNQSPREVMQHGSKAWAMNRTVTEIASLSLKSDGLTDLVNKTGKHLELIEDIDAQDPIREKGTRSSE